MTPKELTALAKVCQKHGIYELHTDSVHIKLDPAYKQPSVAKPAETATEESASVSPTEEEILYWSSGQVNG